MIDRNLAPGGNSGAGNRPKTGKNVGAGTSKLVGTASTNGAAGKVGRVNAVKSAHIWEGMVAG